MEGGRVVSLMCGVSAAPVSGVSIGLAAPGDRVGVEGTGSATGPLDAAKEGVAMNSASRLHLR
jgi:hypothetical protein